MSNGTYSFANDSTLIYNLCSRLQHQYDLCFEYYGTLPRYLPDPDQFQLHHWHAHVHHVHVLDWSLRSLQQLDSMLEPLSDQQIMLLQTRNESMTWYRLLQDNAKTLRRSASMHGFEALWHCRSKIWTGVGESIEPERLNSAGDGGWECEFDSFLRLELVLRILNIEDNEHRRWKFSATDFDMLMTRGDNIGTWAEVARPRIQEQYGTKPLTVEMGLTHDVLVEWHEAQSVLKLSGTFGVTGRVLNAEESGSLGMFVVVALDWKVKKMLRYADFRSL